MCVCMCGSVWKRACSIACRAFQSRDTKALQNVFYKMQTSDKARLGHRRPPTKGFLFCGISQAVNCKELMKHLGCITHGPDENRDVFTTRPRSFGWDTMDAFTQHDAQERPLVQVTCTESTLPSHPRSSIEFCATDWRRLLKRHIFSFGRTGDQERMKNTPSDGSIKRLFEGILHIFLGNMTGSFCLT